MFHSKILAIIIVLSVAVPLIVDAQESHAYKLVPQTVYEQQPVKVTRWVDETVHDTQRVTTYKMVWQTETRQRHNVEYKPVRKTSEREERVVVRKPVVETLLREKRTEQTTYDEVTEMRDEIYTVRKPVTETQMREEQVTVRKPVTQKLIEVQRTTTYKPVVRTQTQMVPLQAVVSQCQSAVDPTQRPRVQRLDSGYYTDPVTGQSVFRRRGLHWAQPTVSVPVAATVPALVPQQVSKVDYVPETTEQRKPVEITRFVEKVETRKVPIEVERIIEETATRKVPVTVKVPRTKVTIEQVPYTKTTYRDEVTVTKVPYTETTYEKVETVEPYTVEVPRWIPETKEVQVPRTVRKRVEYEEMREVPRTVMIKVPLDVCGNPLPEVLPISGEPSEPGSLESEFSTAYGTTTSRATFPPTKTENFSPVEGNSILNDEQPAKIQGYPGELKLVDPKTLDETSVRSVVEPDASLTVESPEMKLKSTVPPARDAGQGSNKVEADGGAKPIDETSGRNEDGDAEAKSADTIGKVKMPEDSPGETGDEDAAERPPVPQTELESPK